jgi:hypothetical protein
LRPSLSGTTAGTVNYVSVGRHRDAGVLSGDLLPSLVLCLDVLMNGEADFIKEIRYLTGLMRQNCQDASWRMERLLSKLEDGESLNTRSTSVQLGEARTELQLMMRGIEGIEKLCELESEDDS